MASPLFGLRRLGSPRQLAAALHKETAGLFSRRAVARALLRQRYDCTAFRQYLDSDVHQSIKIREPREDERVCERCLGPCSAATSGAQADIFGRASTDALSSHRKSDDCNTIEFGTCRSGRKGGSSGPITVGYGKLREQRGGARS